LVIIALLCGALVIVVARPTRERAPRVFYVATDGSDRAPGTLDRPFGTLGHALAQLRPGDTLTVRGGTYHEALRDVTIAPGTAAAPIAVRAYPGERPVLAGLLWLTNADYWTFDGLNVTWDAQLAGPNDHMLKLTGGLHWLYTNAEIWGARSYAALLVTGGASDWTLSNLFVHDTQATNDPSQDQLIYVSDARRGLIANNLLVNSPNGRGIKLGRPQRGDHAPSEITVRDNTIVANAAGNVSISYDAHDNVIERNILVESGRDANVAAFQLDANTNNVVRDNICWNGAQALESPSALVDGGDNQTLDPQLDANYRPMNPALLGADGVPLYGHLAAAGE
jgi:hypothetical protein